MNGDPRKINPLVPCDLVVDHSVQVDRFASIDALSHNVEREFQRNQERYGFLRWGQQAFDNFRVIPPATGIVHQVNLEYLARVVMVENGVAYPDSLVGTDSHTTMINGLGVAGWGVGGIEAEAVMLGQPIYMLTPEVVGFRLFGQLPEGATATDLVLTVTQMLRDHGVVGKFVEFHGEGLEVMSLADGPRWPTWPRNTEPPWASSRSTRRRCGTWNGRAGPPRRSTWSNGTRRNRDCFAPPNRPPRVSAARWNSTWAPSSRRWPAPNAPRTASRSPPCNPSGTRTWPRHSRNPSHPLRSKCLSTAKTPRSPTARWSSLRSPVAPTPATPA
ncbi:MAG: hypothetical protein CM1200mP2_53630 [Planctomycetaceae bacterium]|nr:MAG: hypothetical protein CM1200mP2_53630 [Planctomycetaceae bacterium]